MMVPICVMLPVTMAWFVTGSDACALTSRLGKSNRPPRKIATNALAVSTTVRALSRASSHP
ncbi:MAG: hypothetical protein ACE5JL_08735 [Dehalococcoidia bacterium]